jgi:hypothetical protein
MDRRLPVIMRVLAIAGIVLAAAGCASGANSGSENSSPTLSTQTTTAQHHSRHHRRGTVHHTRAVRHKHRRHRAIVRATHAGVPAVDVPNPALTPGAVLTTSAAKVCVSGYSSSVRDVPDSEKEAAYARYGVPHVAYRHEVDHLVSLEVGGSNAITNLWPEPYAGRWGART